MGGQLYAFVHIDNCEVCTRSVDADTSVAWNQKMAFPSCGTKSIINVEIKTESSPSISVASKVAFAPRCPPRALRTRTAPSGATPCCGGALAR